MHHTKKTSDNTLTINRTRKTKLRKFTTEQQSQPVFAQLSVRIFIRDREGACHNNSYGFSLELVRGNQITAARDSETPPLHFLAPGYHACPLKVLRAAPNLLHDRTASILTGRVTRGTCQPPEKGGNLIGRYSVTAALYFFLKVLLLYEYVAEKYCTCI